MDPERVPPLHPSEIISPVHADISGTIHPDPFNPSYPNVPRTTGRIDTNNLSSYAGHVPTESPSLENQEPIRSPLLARLPEPNSRRRETGINNERFSNTMAQIHSGSTSMEGEPEPEAQVGRFTVGERLYPTLRTARKERDKYAAKAKLSAFMLNAAIGMQVLLGSLTTGLSALSASGGKSTASATTALGALATLVASYLARARSSNDLELSITRTNNLEEFIRQCESCTMDSGHLTGHEFDREVNRLRRRFEELLGNVNGLAYTSNTTASTLAGNEKKIAPV